MSVKKIIFFPALFLIVTFANSEEGLNNACLQLTKDCVLLRTYQTEACYQSSTQHPFCQDTEIGSVLKSRLNYSSGKLSAEKNINALGSKLVDRLCLKEFDKLLLTVKINHADMLKSKIVSCLKNVNIDSY